MSIAEPGCGIIIVAAKAETANCTEVAIVVVGVAIVAVGVAIVALCVATFVVRFLSLPLPSP